MIIIKLNLIIKMLMDRGWTFSKLSTESGVSNVTLSNMKKTKRIKMTTAVKLASALGCKPSELMEEE